MNYLFAIWANRNTCKPVPRGTPGAVKHVVRVNTETAAMTIVNEFTTSPAADSHVACAPSSIYSWLLDCTEIRTTMAIIELHAGTNPNTGTTFQGCEDALSYFGQEFQQSSDAVPGAVMNPGGGYIDPESDFKAYLAARQGGDDCLVLVPLSEPPPPPPPPPVPTPQPEDEPVILVIQPVANPSDQSTWVTVPGLLTNANLNLSTMAPGGCNVTAYCYDPKGKPLGGKVTVLKGNLSAPGTGPIEAAGYLYQLAGAAAPTAAEPNVPCVLVLVPSTKTYTVNIH